MHHVVLLLEGYVDDGVRDLFADSVKKLSFTDDHSQFGVKVNLVSIWTLLKNWFFEELNCFRRL